MIDNTGVEIVRATIFHTPRNPFVYSNALSYIQDGAIAIDGGRIAACDDYARVVEAYPDAPVRDLRGGYILPGLIDTHIHFPQVRIIGGLGQTLLDWLQRLTLPEEAKLQNPEYSRAIADEFVDSLRSHGTTTALVFGSHFESATAALFEAAQQRGLRIFSGLVMADRLLRDELHQTPDQAWCACKSLIGRYHAKARVGYAVTPRFALSASEPMLEVSQALLREDPELRFTTHINESPREVDEVLRHFPWAADYLAVYERFDLIGRRSVIAHNVHPTDSELDRFAAHDASIAHCPCSNAMLGSGIFPLQRHVDKQVRVALGTDVGGGTGFGILKEALHTYMFQRVAAEPMCLNVAQMLYLATRAGAEALDLDTEIGDLAPGKAADFVYLRAPERSPLDVVLRSADQPERVLAALFTLGGAESIREVRVEGELVYG